MQTWVSVEKTFKAMDLALLMQATGQLIHGDVDKYCSDTCSEGPEQDPQGSSTVHTALTPHPDRSR